MKKNITMKTSRELATYLGCSEACVIKWRAAGLPYKQVGFYYSYNLEDVLKWLVKRSPRHKRWVESLAERLRERKQCQQDG